MDVRRLIKISMNVKKIEQQVSANKHDIEQTFNDIDTDRSGSITREEFITCLEGMMSI